MTADGLSPAMRRFVDYFADLGPRWGLPAEACRVHAYLYVVARPSSEAQITGALALEIDVVAKALSFLMDYRMVDRVGPSSWCTSGDPWNELASGLEQRRRRELAPALVTLRDCHSEALADGASNRIAARQIGKMLELVEGLAVLDTQVHRLSPHLLRGLVGLSGRTARFMDRAFGAKRGARS